EELMHAAKELGAPYELVRHVAAAGRLPVPNFAAGGIATPADAALMMALGAEAVFVGSGIFKSSDPAARARAIVLATTHHADPRARAPGRPAGGGRGRAGRGGADARAGRGLHPRRRSTAGPRLVSEERTLRGVEAGVLALQGGFAPHLRILRGLGAATREVRR